MGKSQSLTLNTGQDDNVYHRFQPWHWSVGCFWLLLRTLTVQGGTKCPERQHWQKSHPWEVQSPSDLVKIPFPECFVKRHIDLNSNKTFVFLVLFSFVFAVFKRPKLNFLCHYLKVGISWRTEQGNRRKGGGSLVPVEASLSLAISPLWWFWVISSGFMYISPVWMTTRVPT